VLGTHAEHLEVAPAGRPGGADAGVAMQVELVEPLGHESLVHLRAEGVELTARAGAHPGAAMGEAAIVRVDPERVHLFDAESGAVVAARDGAPATAAAGPAPVA